MIEYGEDSLTNGYVFGWYKKGLFGVEHVEDDERADLFGDEEN
jgi:hypothetical protein